MPTITQLATPRPHRSGSSPTKRLVRSAAVLSIAIGVLASSVGAAPVTPSALPPTGPVPTPPPPASPGTIVVSGAGSGTVESAALAVSSVPGSAGNGSSGAKKFSPLIVRRTVGQLSTSIGTFAATGQHAATMEIRSGKSTYLLTDVTVTDYAVDGDKETIGLNYARINVTVGSRSWGFDVKTATPLP